jgi:uncharacterized protein
MIIDMHIHPYCREVSLLPDIDTGLQRQFDSPYRPASKEKIALRKKLFTQGSVKDILALMDESRIDRAVIVAFDLTTTYGVVMVTNQDVSRLAAARPDRLIPFASVDPSLGRPAVDELVHAIRDLGCQGVKLCPPVQKFDFSDPRFQPLWEKALELNTIVWTHASHQMGHPGSDARLGSPMLVEPVALRYPGLKIVLGHCGFPWVWEAWSLALRHANVYVDISAYPNLYNHFPWDAYAKSGLEHKVLFATDYPLYTWQKTLAALEAVDISEAFRRKILGENAQALLGL